MPGENNYRGHSFLDVTDPKVSITMKKSEALWISPHTDRRIAELGMHKCSVMSIHCSHNVPPKHTAHPSHTSYVEIESGLISSPAPNLSNGIDPTENTFT